LWICTALSGIYRALFRKCGAFIGTCKAILGMYRALMEVYRAFLGICRALLVVDLEQEPLKAI